MMSLLCATFARSFSATVLSFVMSPASESDMSSVEEEDDCNMITLLLH